MERKVVLANKRHGCPLLTVKVSFFLKLSKNLPKMALRNMQNMTFLGIVKYTNS